MITYIDFGKGFIVQRIGTASGVLHRKQETITQRPHCDSCGTQERYQRKLCEELLSAVPEN